MPSARTLVAALLASSAVLFGCQDKCSTQKDCQTGYRCDVTGSSGVCIACESAEIPYDGVDDDCDPATPDTDLDGDGDNWIHAPTLPGTDCDDRDPRVSGKQPETCDDGKDNNCDGEVDEIECRDHTPPVVRITYPLSGQLITSGLHVTVEATDDVGVAKVDLYEGSTLLRTITAAPYELALAASEVTDGPATFRAVATDIAGRTASASVNVVLDLSTPPVITPAAPVAGGAYDGALSVELTATDDGSGVDEVTADLDGAPVVLSRRTPYRATVDTTALTEGTHTLNVHATDRAGHGGTTAIQFLVDRTPPVVTFVAPTNNATITGPAPASVEAFDVSGIREIRLGDATSPSSPLRTNIDPHTIGIGYVTLTAIAHDRTIIDGDPRGHRGTASVAVFSDNGSILPCTDVLPFPASGVARGTLGTVDHSAGVCGGAGIPDVVYEYVAPTNYFALRLEAARGGSFDPVLRFHREACGPAFDAVGRAGLPACANAEELLHVTAGEHLYIVVEGSSATDAGSYEVSLRGALEYGQPCDPADTLNLCCDPANGPGLCLLFGNATAGCQDRGAGFACDGLDCRDGADQDNDGRVDEDAAVCQPGAPPPCLPEITTYPGRYNETRFEQLGATAVGGSPWEWRALAGPPGWNRANAFGSTDDVTRFEPRVLGRYQVRREDVSWGGVIAPCDMDIAYYPRPTTALYAEVFWNDEFPNPGAEQTNVDLHLLPPGAGRFNGPPVIRGSLDCSVYNATPEWGDPASADDDAYLVWYAEYGRGPEAIGLDRPQLGQGAYRVGVWFMQDRNGWGQAVATVNIYCYGALAATIGPQRLTLDQLWRAADVTFTDTSCDVQQPLQGGVPYITRFHDMDGDRR